MTTKFRVFTAEAYAAYVKIQVWLVRIWGISVLAEFFYFKVTTVQNIVIMVLAPMALLLLIGMIAYFWMKSRLEITNDGVALITSGNREEWHAKSIKKMEIETRSYSTFTGRTHSLNAVSFLVITLAGGKTVEVTTVFTWSMNSLSKTLTETKLPYTEVGYNQVFANSNFASVWFYLIIAIFIGIIIWQRMNVKYA